MSKVLAAEPADRPPGSRVCDWAGKEEAATFAEARLGAHPLVNLGGLVPIASGVVLFSCPTSARSPARCCLGARTGRLPNAVGAVAGSAMVGAARWNRTSPEVTSVRHAPSPPQAHPKGGSPDAR